MKDWKLAPAIEQFKKQLNAMFPNRDRVSDGFLGDLAHSKRKSSHNPDKFGFVRAMDVTHNPEKGIDGNLLLNALLSAKDSRIWYIIFNRKIYNRKNNFKPEVYTGENAHKHHLHLSVADDPNIYNDASDWNLSFGQPQATQTASPTISTTFTELKKGSKGEAVKKLQTILHQKGFLGASGIDSDFGEKTDRAVRAFQTENGLRVDGRVGVNTAAALGIK